MINPKPVLKYNFNNRWKKRGEVKRTERKKKNKTREIGRKRKTRRVKKKI